MKLPIDEIEVGERYRRDMGDLDALKASIKDVGLIQPIVVSPNKELISGGRRLAAVRELGWVRVDVHIKHGMDDAAAVVQAERDENTCREEMRVSELVAIGKRLEELKRPQAREVSLSNLREGGSPTGSREPVGETAQIVGGAIGISATSYKRARRVVDLQQHEDPLIAEVARKATEEMDRTGKISTADRKIQQALKQTGTQPEKPKSPPKHGPRRKHLQVIESIATALAGLVTAATEITELDGTVTSEEATRLSGDLSKHLRTLGRLNALLKKEITK